VWRWALDRRFDRRMRGSGQTAGPSAAAPSGRLPIARSMVALRADPFITRHTFCNILTTGQSLRNRPCARRTARCARRRHGRDDSDVTRDLRARSRDSSDCDRSDGCGARDSDGPRAAAPVRRPHPCPTLPPRPTATP
jgi:hypothetical protein